MAATREYTSDQSMSGANDLEVLDPSLAGMIETGLALGTSLNTDLVKFLVPGSYGDGSASAIFTPGMMRFIDDVWTPSLDLQFGTGSYNPNDQLGYIDSSTQPLNLDPQAVVSQQQPEPQQRGKRQSPSNTAQEKSAAAAPPKKKRRERNKKVRTQEEEQRNRENFLERNRKAAQKCRQRKKVWMEGIQQKKDAASQLMNILGMEVIHLVEEVKKLRALADAHRFCEYGNLEHPRELLVAEPISKGYNSAGAACNDEPSRRDSEATVDTSSIEEGSTDDSVRMLPIEQSLEEFSDPCWKLAKEVRRRFAEVNPGFIPVLPQLSSYDAYHLSRSNPVGTSEDHDEQVFDGGLAQDFNQRVDSGFSEMSTPHDTKSNSLKMDGVSKSKKQGHRNTGLAPSLTLPADSQELNAVKGLTD